MSEARENLDLEITWKRRRQGGEADTPRDRQERGENKQGGGEGSAKRGGEQATYASVVCVPVFPFCLTFTALFSFVVLCVARTAWPAQRTGEEGDGTGTGERTDAQRSKSASKQHRQTNRQDATPTPTVCLSCSH